MHDENSIKDMMHQRGINPIEQGLESVERKDVKNAYYNYQKAVRKGKNVEQAEKACLAAIAAYDKSQTQSNKLEELLG
jgi:hypothetical protein